MPRFIKIYFTATYDKLLNITFNSVLGNLTTIIGSTKKLNHINFNKLVIELDLDFNLDLIENFIQDINPYLEIYIEEPGTQNTKEVELTAIPNKLINTKTLIIGLRYLKVS